MHRRSFLRGVPLLMALPMVPAACSHADSLRLGLHAWIGYESFFLARHFGWLPPAITLQELTDASESLAALRAGQIDAACLTLDELLLARAKGAPLTVIAILDVSAGADVVLARAGLSFPAGMAGKKIAVEKSAVGELMLAKLLEAGRVDPLSVTVLDIPPDKQLDAWRSGQIDVAVTYEPVASRLLALGAVRIFDSRQVPETIFDVLAVRRDRMASHAELLRELVKAHFLGLTHLRVQREDAIYRIAARLGSEVEAVRQALAGVVLPDLTGNRRYLASGSRLWFAANTLNNLLIKRGALAEADSLEHLFDSAFLPKEESRP